MVAFAAVTLFASGPFWGGVVAEALSGRWDWAIWTMPSLWMIGVLVSTYRNNRSWPDAAVWMQFALAVLSAYYFALLFTLDYRMVLLGGKISLAASLVLAIATAWQLAKNGLRFNLKVLFVGITWSALAFAAAMRWGQVGFSVFAFASTMFLLAWLEFRRSPVRHRTWTKLIVGGAYLIIIAITAVLTAKELLS